MPFIERITNLLSRLFSLVCTFLVRIERKKFSRHDPYLGHTGVLRIWGERLFLFRELDSLGNYFRAAGEQAHSFGDLGSPVQK